MTKSKIYSIFVVGLAIGLVIGLVQPIRGVYSALGSQATLLAGERQEVLAVRSVKPAVVSIVGSTKVSGSLNTRDTIFGTGFIITPDGYIVSNSHVVANVSAVYRVELLDGKTLPVTIVGVDTLSDIALLKVAGEKMATIRFGNSDGLETGQTVFAIGYALGKYQHTVTKGVVAGLGRNVDLQNSKPRLQNLIQTDATINPGNSGGPLVNTLGEVVGMNTLVDGSSGLGFSIPSNHIKSIVDLLKSTGKASRPYLGITYVGVDQLVKENESLKTDYGALVTEVVIESSAYRSGIRPGDVITAINNELVDSKNELDELLQKYQAGSQVLLTVDRYGQKMEMLAILAEYR